MASYDYGKDYVCAWIRENVPRDAEILDVGACDGKWRNLLPEYQNMDAVEIYEPNASCIEDLYRLVVNEDIYDFRYKWYDLVIFGDVLEHLSVDRAQAAPDWIFQPMMLPTMAMAIMAAICQEPVRPIFWPMAAPQRVEASTAMARKTTRPPSPPRVIWSALSKVALT